MPGSNSAAADQQPPPPATGESVRSIDDKLSEQEKAARTLAAKQKAASDKSRKVVDQLNKTYALLILGGKTAVIDTSSEDRLELWDKQAFMDYFANKKTETVDDKGKSKWQSIAQVWFNDPRRRQYKRVIFAPGEKAGPEEFNLWRGWGVEPKQGAGSWDTLKEHILVNVCSNNQETYDWVLQWLAHSVQSPMQKPGTSLVMRGRPGTGKSTIGDIMGRIMGKHRVIARNARYITGQFNSHLEHAVLLQAEEATFGGDKAVANEIKDLITNEYIQIERKGKEPITVRSCFRLLVTSNEGWPVPVTLADRRFTILDVGNRNEEDRKFFGQLWSELNAGGLEAFFHYLLTLPVDADKLSHPIETEARTELMVQTMDSMHSWWLECLEDGRVCAQQDERTVRVDEAHTSYLGFCEKKKDRYPKTKGEMGVFLFSLCPGLTKDRPRQYDGSRPWRYILPTLPECRAEMQKAMKVSTYNWPDSDDWCGFPIEQPAETEAESPLPDPELFDEDMPF